MPRVGRKKRMAAEKNEQKPMNYALADAAFAHIAQMEAKSGRKNYGASWEVYEDGRVVMYEGGKVVSETKIEVPEFDYESGLYSVKF